MGSDIHEHPQVGAGGEALEIGNVITIESGLYCPGLGGFRIGDAVVIMEKGWLYLALCEKSLSCCRQ